MIIANTIYTDSSDSYESLISADFILWHIRIHDLFFNVFVYVMCVKVKLASSSTLNPEA